MKSTWNGYAGIKLKSTFIMINRDFQMRRMHAVFDCMFLFEWDMYSHWNRFESFAADVFGMIKWTKLVKLYRMLFGTTFLQNKFRMHVRSTADYWFCIFFRINFEISYFQLPFVETSRYFYVILLSGKISIFFLLFCILIISLMEKCLHSSRIFIKFWTKWNTWSKPHLHLKRNAFSHCAIFCIVRHVSCVR